MSKYDQLMAIGVTTFFGGMIIWMIFQQIIINYIQKHLKSICRDLYGNEDHYTGKLDMYDMMYLQSLTMSLFLTYNLVYKNLGRFTLFNRHKDIELFFPNLNEKKALIFIKKHKKWFHLMTFSTFIWLLFFFSGGAFFWFAERY